MAEEARCGEMTLAAVWQRHAHDRESACFSSLTWPYGFVMTHAEYDRDEVES
jgi:hypothetical protein